MNRRKRKKQFKKVTGITLEQWEEYKRGWAAKNLTKGIKEAREREKQQRILCLAEREIRNGITTILRREKKKWEKEIQIVAGFIETEEMLRKAHYLPEGADKELLQDKGLRADSSGAYWHFYYDEANEEHFVELVQERRCPDDSSTH